jgi:hypothetical protein
MLLWVQLGVIDNFLDDFVVAEGRSYLEWMPVKSTRDFNQAVSRKLCQKAPEQFGVVQCCSCGHRVYQVVQAFINVPWDFEAIPDSRN